MSIAEWWWLFDAKQIEAAIAEKGVHFSDDVWTDLHKRHKDTTQ